MSELSAQYVTEESGTVFRYEVDLASEFRYRRPDVLRRIRRVIVVCTVRRDGRQSCRACVLQRSMEFRRYRDRQCSRLNALPEKADHVFYTLCRTGDLGCDDKGVQRTVGRQCTFSPYRLAKVKGRIDEKRHARIARGTVQNSRIRFREALDDKERIQWFAT